MYIESVIAKKSIQFGTCSIPLFKENNDIDSLEDRTLYINKNESLNNKNYFTYFIGDNGCGKTKLLHALSLTCKSPKGLSFRMNSSELLHFKTNMKSPFSYTIYIGNKLFYGFNDPNSCYILFNTIDIYSATLKILREFYDLSQMLQKFTNLDIPEHVYFVAQVYLIDENVVQEIKNGTYPIIAFLDGLLDENHQSRLLEHPKYLSLREKYHSDWNSIFKNSTAHHILEELCRNIKKVPREFSSKNRIGSNLSPLYYQVKSLSDFDIELLLLAQELDLIHIEIECNKITEPDVKFNIDELSSGEQMMIKLFYCFAKIPSDIRENVLILIDEPEISLHPKWQQKLPEYFYNALECMGFKKSHLIIATHSPLVVQHAYDVEGSELKDTISVIKISRVGKDLICEKITKEDILRFNIESLLLDQFDISYYSDKDVSKIKELIFQKSENDRNRILEVKHAYEIKERIANLHKIFIKNEICKKK